jgi:hypothetical protein
MCTTILLINFFKIFVFFIQSKELKVTTNFNLFKKIIYKAVTYRNFSLDSFLKLFIMINKTQYVYYNL